MYRKYGIPLSTFHLVIEKLEAAMKSSMAAVQQKEQQITRSMQAQGQMVPRDQLMAHLAEMFQKIQSEKEKKVYEEFGVLESQVDEAAERHRDDPKVAKWAKWTQSMLAALGGKGAGEQKIPDELTPQKILQITEDMNDEMFKQLATCIEQLKAQSGCSSMDELKTKLQTSPALSQQFRTILAQCQEQSQKKIMSRHNIKDFSMVMAATGQYQHDEEFARSMLEMQANLKQKMMEIGLA